MFAAHVIAVFLLSLGAAALVVATRGWHERYTGDANNGGIQKHHTGAPPRVGLVPIASGLALGYFWLRWSGTTTELHEASQLLGLLLLCAIPVAGLGLQEDLTKRVSPKQRMFGAAVSALLAWLLLGAEISRIDIPAADAALQFAPLALALTLLMVAGFTNAMNIVDGLNGLASGLAVAMLAATAAVATSVGDTAIATLCLLLMAAVLGFMVLNFPRGLMFLGDGGAYLIGFLIAEIWILLFVRNPTITVWVGPLIGFLPTFETIFSIVRRKFILRRKMNAMAPDRLHLHSLMYRRRAMYLFSAVPAHRRWVPNSIAAATLVVFASLPTLAATINPFSPMMAGILFVVSALCYLWAFMWLTRARLGSARRAQTQNNQSAFQVTGS